MKANVGFSDKEIMKAQRKYAKMSDEELGEKLEHVSVYARVSPEHKSAL